MNNTRALNPIKSETARQMIKLARLSGSGTWIACTLSGGVYGIGNVASKLRAAFPNAHICTIGHYDRALHPLA